MSQAERASRTSGYLPYFSLLLASTVAEVIIAVFSRMDRSLYVTVLVLLASTKVSLLAGYFMCLRQERWQFSWMLLAPAILGSGFIVGTALVEKWGTLG